MRPEVLPVPPDDDSVWSMSPDPDPDQTPLESEADNPVEVLTQPEDD